MLGYSPILRLLNVSFLGALSSGHDEVDTRFQHSLGTAYIASTIADASRLTPRSRRYLVAHGLLHDIAHWPLAHTCEATFEELTRHSGKSLRAAMITGDPSVPSEYRIRMRLSRLGLDPAIVLALLEKRPVLRHPVGLEVKAILDIVSSPINPDTLDGIFRSAHLVHLPCPDPLEVVLAFTREADAVCIFRDRLPLLDDFWISKARVYRQFINRPDSKIWETRYAKAALERLRDANTRDALGYHEDRIRDELENWLAHVHDSDVTRFAFRPPRTYFIDESVAWQTPFVPISELNRRYKSEVIDGHQ
jgi:HD superfamily phosphohydrolase